MNDRKGTTIKQMNSPIETADIYIYPVKSLGQVQCSEIKLSNYGLEDDRRWMIVDKDGNMVTQREYPTLNLIRCSLSKYGYSLINSQNKTETVEIFSNEELGPPIRVKVWKTELLAYKTQALASEWISEYLKGHFTLVAALPMSRMKKNSFLTKEHELKFQDAYPIHIVNAASVEKLSDWCGLQLSAMQFRPNMIIKLREAFAEDIQEEFVINGIVFEKVKKCERCVISTIKPGEDKINKEPLYTLSKKRKVGNAVNFGVYLVAKK